MIPCQQLSIRTHSSKQILHNTVRKQRTLKIAIFLEAFCAGRKASRGSRRAQNHVQCWPRNRVRLSHRPSTRSSTPSTPDAVWMQNHKHTFLPITTWSTNKHQFLPRIIKFSMTRQSISKSTHHAHLWGWNETTWVGGQGVGISRGQAAFGCQQRLLRA